MNAKYYDWCTYILICGYYTKRYFYYFNKISESAERQMRCAIAQRICEVFNYHGTPQELRGWGHFAMGNNFALLFQKRFREEFCLPRLCYPMNASVGFKPRDLALRVIKNLLCELANKCFFIYFLL